MTEQEWQATVVGLVGSTAELRKELAELRQAQMETSLALADWIAEQEPPDDKWLVELREEADERAKTAALEKLLFDQLGMRDLAHGHRVYRQGRQLVIGMLAWGAPERKEVIIVEEHRQFTAADIQELVEQIEQFPQFFPTQRDYKIYGLVAAREIPEELRQEVLQRGFYLVRTGRRTCKLQVPPGFKAKAFGPAAEANGNGRKKNGGRKRSPK